MPRLEKGKFVTWPQYLVLQRYSAYHVLCFEMQNAKPQGAPPRRAWT
jgi:hypothetical protein